jgi:hypothetical protein
MAITLQPAEKCAKKGREAFTLFVTRLTHSLSDNDDNRM